MKPKDHEEQLRQFFNNNTLDDQMLLKKYVREHPTNKMAWYLLGREYDGQGKRGKALYCYGQAGEIYEAFENQTITVSLESQEALEQLDRRGKRRRWLSRARLAVLLAMIVFGIAYLPAFAPAPEPETQTALPALPKDVSLEQVQQTKVYYIAGAKTKERVGAALQEMLIKERINSYAILASGKLTEDGKWISWLQPPDILLSVEGKQDAAQQQIQYHDAESCQCVPTEDSKPKSIYQSWMGQREQEVVLRSAIDAYRRMNGKLPENLQALNQPHPQNILPGVTPFMEQLYEQDKAQLTDTVTPQGSPSASGTPTTVPPSQGSGSSGNGQEASASGLQKPLKDPLRIIVDKTNHRLALVSGTIIVRSYPVGLGADRTPEGTFEIAEKVRNPNGKSNGDFGSRGMGLSNPLYAIHGTNKPNSIGKDESLGCVRMLKEDIEELFDMAPIGTPVTIGKGLLPSEIKRGEPVFTLPLTSNETNPGKVYKWLD
ncbi:L,D-transpeptidase [Paenibacillus sp. FSL H7-0331]|uniref:L,D-transpeptidase n=1 Tax=Paenibacillus sp. FSL H7-0331 TaxID=1920421 RepID=UPI00211702DA|nr:L,D-transpeptidase [Paenibacillus sp. FSL H7-0331]